MPDNINDPTPIPPEVSGPNTPRKALAWLAWLWQWGHVHTFVAGCAVGSLVTAVIMGKL